MVDLRQSDLEQSHGVYFMKVCVCECVSVFRAISYVNYAKICFK